MKIYTHYIQWNLHKLWNENNIGLCNTIYNLVSIQRFPDYTGRFMQVPLNKNIPYISGFLPEGIFPDTRIIFFKGWEPLIYKNIRHICKNTFHKILNYVLVMQILHNDIFFTFTYVQYFIFFVPEHILKQWTTVLDSEYSIWSNKRRRISYFNSYNMLVLIVM